MFSLYSIADEIAIMSMMIVILFILLQVYKSYYEKKYLNGKII